jgi:hypothetical protein
MGQRKASKLRPLPTADIALITTAAAAADGRIASQRHEAQPHEEGEALHQLLLLTLCAQVVRRCSSRSTTATTTTTGAAAVALLSCLFVGKCTKKWYNNT